MSYLPNVSIDASILSFVIAKPTAFVEIQRAGITSFSTYPSQNKQWCSCTCAALARSARRRKEWRAKNYRGRLKHCHVCNTFKRISEFHRNDSAPDKLHTKCKPCSCAKTKAYNLINKEQLKIKGRLKNYGITNKTFRRLLARQKGCCAVCHKSFKSFKKEPHVDHCHETKKIRGLLCGPCNLAIGLIADDPKVARRMAKYLAA